MKCYADSRRFLSLKKLLLIPGLLLVASAAHAHNISPSVLTVGTDYFLLGLEHLWGGWDHVAFLVALLLPGGRWGQMLKIVTAFTLSHSLTLTLVATGQVAAATWLVEPLIALTIVVVAVSALRQRPPLGQTLDLRFELALCFGLIHGMGFAGALAEVGMPAGRVLPALAGFNVGLEVAQITLVLTVLPLVLWLRSLSPSTYRLVLTTASSFIGIFGSVWLIERIFGGIA